jgi:hypothetical protein
LRRFQVGYGDDIDVFAARMAEQAQNNLSAGAGFLRTDILKLKRGACAKNKLRKKGSKNFCRCESIYGASS